MERIHEELEILDEKILLRDAVPEDALAIQQLFERVYQGKYPLAFGTDVAILVEEIKNPKQYLWIVSEDLKKGTLAGAMMLNCDLENRVAKAGGGVVVPEYRHCGLASTMLKKGVEFVTEKNDLVDVIYGTSRTINESPSKMVAEAGFQKMGIFPNAVQIEDFEHLNLDIYLTKKSLEIRRKKPILFPPFNEIYEIARKQLKLEKAHLVTERAPLTLSKKKLPLTVCKDPKVVAEKFQSYLEQKRISNSFFPFHSPNWMLSSADGGTDVFIWYGGNGKQASILGYRTDQKNLRDVLDAVAITLQRSGAVYVELLVDAYDYVIQQEAYTAKYIPSAYFPSMHLTDDGRRNDYFVVSRTFQILDFTNSFVTIENVPYLEAYMHFYHELYIKPMQRSSVQRKK